MLDKTHIHGRIRETTHPWRIIMFCEDGWEFSNGDIIPWPERDDLTLRRVDQNGNTEEVRETSDSNWSEWYDLFKVVVKIVHSDGSLDTIHERRERRLQVSDSLFDIQECVGNMKKVMKPSEKIIVVIGGLEFEHEPDLVKPIKFQCSYCDATIEVYSEDQLAHSGIPDCQVCLEDDGEERAMKRI